MNPEQINSIQFLLIVIVAVCTVASADGTTNRQSVPDRSMVELIGDKYDRMAKYLSLADLEKDVSSNELTFFVPSDEAFRDVPWSIAQEMLVNSTFLRLVIENHIIPGTFPSNKLPGNSIFSVGGEALNFTKKTVKDCDLVLINSIPILEPDQTTTNGIVHGITKLILPQRLIDDCKCGQSKANDFESTIKTSTPTSNLASNIPERIIAGHSGQPNLVTITPGNGNAPDSGKFLRRSQAANPEFAKSSGLNGSLPTTPFPYYNVWDDLVANHNLTTGNQPDNKTREIEEERPRFFRTRISSRVSTESSSPSSTSPSNATNSGTSNDIGGAQGPSSYYDNNSASPTPPPRFGLRRRVVIRPQPTPRPYQNDSKSNSDVGPTSRPNDNNNADQLVPSVYYAEDEEGVTHSDASLTYSPPLVYLPISSTTPRPFIRVTSPTLDTHRRSHDGRLMHLDATVSNESNPSQSAPNTNPNHPTRRPYLRRPVPRGPDTQGNGRNASDAVRCYPEDMDCLILADAKSDNSPADGESLPVRHGPQPRTETETIRLQRPVTRYYLNDQTTPSTTFFDSTRRPTSRNPQGIWRSTAPPVTPQEDDSANYVRRFGSQRPRNGSSQIIRPTTTTGSQIYYNYGPVGPVDNRATQGDLYRPSRTNSNEPVHPREPKADEQPNVDSNTIADILEDPGLFLEKRPISFSMFKDLMRRAALHNLASSKRPITVFLPTDDAFEQLENKGFDRIYRNPADLQNFLLRHLVNYPVKPIEMRDGLVIRSISNSPITIKSFDDGMKVYANGSPILAATEATNGYVYVLGRVISDADNKVKTDILKQIEQLDNASIFASLLRRSNLTPQLQEGHWTILVPDNEAFAEIQPQIRDRILSEPEMIQSLVGNHIINGSFSSEKLARSINILPLVGQKPLKIRAFPEAVILNNQASIKKPDLEAQNGIIHLINRVLLPDNLAAKQTTAGRGRGRAYDGLNDFSNQFKPRRGLHIEPDDKPQDAGQQELGPKMKARKFVSWLEKSGILEQLRQNGSSFTMIVPNDEAVGKLPSRILNQLDSEPENLKTLLTYHAILGDINLLALQDGQVLKSLDDKPIQYTKLASNGSLLSGAPVVDEYTQRGMKFLVVNRVLYPPRGTIFDIVSGSPILTNISQIIKTANLVSEFSDSPGPYTLFAPIDQAFASLGQDELVKVTRDIKSSRDFLVKHTLKSVLFTSAIPMNDGKGIQVDNINKTSISLQRKPHYVTANGVPLAYADITATNGVIHVLSSPL